MRIFAGLLSALFIISCAEQDGAAPIEAPTVTIGFGTSLGGGGNGNCAGVDCQNTGGGGGTKIGIGFNVPLTGGAETLTMRDRNARGARSGQLVVHAKSDASFRAAAEAAGFQVLSRHRLETVGMTIYKLALPSGTSASAALAQAKSLPSVSHAQPNYLYEAKASFNEAIALSGIEPSQGGRGQGRIAIVDGMVATSHPDIAGAGIRQQLIAEDAKPTKHGTAIASLLVGNGTVKGVARGARVSSFVGLRKEASANLTGETFWIAEAIDQAVQSSPQILSLSLGTNQNDPIVATVVKAAIARGVTVVAAAGNGGAGSPPSYPAAYPNVIGVTAVDKNAKIYGRATRGGHVDFAAPGVSLVVAAPGGHDQASGTSFATAIFSGLYLGIANDKGASPSRAFQSQLSENLTDLGPAGKDTTFGAGLLTR